MNMEREIGGRYPPPLKFTHKCAFSMHFPNLFSLHRGICGRYHIRMNTCGLGKKSPQAGNSSTLLRPVHERLWQRASYGCCLWETFKNSQTGVESWAQTTQGPLQLCARLWKCFRCICRLCIALLLFLASRRG